MSIFGDAKDNEGETLKSFSKMHKIFSGKSSGKSMKTLKCGINLHCLPLRTLSFLLNRDMKHDKVR